jgi:hypothetical protein
MDYFTERTVFNHLSTTKAMQADKGGILAKIRLWQL